MQGGGFEPPNTLSEQLLRLLRLTTSLSLLKNITFLVYKKVYKITISCFFGDGHSNQETPDPIPNSEAKLVTPFVLVSDKTRSNGAVSHIFNMIMVAD